MRKSSMRILLGMILLCTTFSAYRGQDKTSPAPDQQEAKDGATSKGVTPRASAAAYAAHGDLEEVSVGATALSPDEVRKVFATDLNHCCVVLEVGLYPDKAKNLSITRNDFSFRVAGTDLAVKPTGPKLLALSLQLILRSERDMTPHGSVETTTGLGGYDPARSGTGPRGRRGGIDGSEEINLGPDRPPTQVTEEDREFMEMELTEKGLPEGKVSAPVAGYLYFPLTKKMKKKKAVRLLEYTNAGQTVTLTLP